MSWLLAAAVAIGIVLTAWLMRALTLGGALAASCVGTVILGTLGWPGGLVLLTFFVSSSIVGRLVGRPQPIDAKGEQRDAWQVGANGGAAAVGALVGLANPATGLWLASAALATAAADTWATAWGSGSRSAPRSVLTGRKVPPGTSGGISLRGTLGAVAGAALVGGAAAAVAGADRLRLLTVLTAIGTGGMLLDSVLGAALQGRFACPACGTPSERTRHACGTPTTHTGGVRWIGNDLVNALATTLTMGLAWLLRLL